METFQCPECELKFRLATELASHLNDDHPAWHVEPTTPEEQLRLEALNRRLHHDRRPEAR
jgi:uncharacterized C2H2 Zn-finger protein